MTILILTSSRNPPNAKQNTNGPARSVSSMMLASVSCNGFNTDNVCNKDDNTILLSVKFLQGASKKFDFKEFFLVEECSLNSEEIPLYF